MSGFSIFVAVVVIIAVVLLIKSKHVVIAMLVAVGGFFGFLQLPLLVAGVFILLPTAILVVGMIIIVIVLFEYILITLMYLITGILALAFLTSWCMVIMSLLHKLPVLLQDKMNTLQVLFLALFITGITILWYREWPDFVKSLEEWNEY